MKMTSKNTLDLLKTYGNLAALLLMALTLSEGCGEKATKPDEPMAATEPAIEPSPAAAPETARDAAPDTQLGSSDTGNSLGLETIHFAFKSHQLIQSQKKILKANADILRSHPTAKIQIEGHCDERGGIQFNIALGEKRAKAARDFLTDQGVSPDQITTISYGKERPIDPGQSEKAYAKNRRANFAVTAIR